MSRSEDDDDFNDRIVTDMIHRLDGPVHVPLSQAEKTALATVAQATLEVGVASQLSSLQASLWSKRPLVYFIRATSLTPGRATTAVPRYLWSALPRIHPNDSQREQAPWSKRDCYAGSYCHSYIPSALLISEREHSTVIQECRLGAA